MTRRRIERENTQVSTTRAPRSGNDPRDRDRDQGKTGPLVDRIEKGDRSEKGDRGEKVDRTDRGGRPEIANRGDKSEKTDKGDKSVRPDRSEKGDRDDKGAGQARSPRDGQPPKLTLPKVDLPKDIWDSTHVRWPGPRVRLDMRKCRRCQLRLRRPSTAQTIVLQAPRGRRQGPMLRVAAAGGRRANSRAIRQT